MPVSIDVLLGRLRGRPEGGGRPRSDFVMSKSTKRVLFVCMGNICRSPTGEGVLRAVIEKRGLSDQIEVDSAGTIGYHVGEPPDARMTRAAAKRGYQLIGRARQVADIDLERFDLIVAMDRDNYRDLIALAVDADQQERIRLLSSFLDGNSPKDVPDPYYGGASGFEKVLDMIEAACDPIIDHMLAAKD